MKIIILTFIMLASVSSVYAWSGSTEVPPGGNPPRPLRTDATSQTKAGPLGVSGFRSSGSSNLFANTNMTVPSNLLVLVKGSLGATEYCDDNGLNCRTMSTIGLQGPQGPQGKGPIPSGGVLAFNRTSCPVGWTKDIAGSPSPYSGTTGGSEGRYIVGLRPGGTLGATVGTPLTDGQNVPTGAHTHTYAYWRSVATGIVTNNDALPGSQMASVPAAETRDVDGGAKPGTNAPYIQLLYCRKN